MFFVQEFYQILPSTRARIDMLIEGDCFLYPNEVITVSYLFHKYDTC